LKHFNSDSKVLRERELLELAALLDKLADLCGDDNASNAAIAARYGGVELVTSICSKVSGCGNDKVITSALKALVTLLGGMRIQSSPCHFFDPFHCDLTYYCS